MSNPWELVLHHDYRGVPGVVFDRSPGRGAHGQLRGVTAADFQTDGATAGSGAVRLRGGNTGIRVDLSKPWNVLNGLGVNIACSSDMFNRAGVLIDGGNFRIEFIPGNIRAWIETATGRASTSIMTNEVVPGGWGNVNFSYVQGLFLGYDGPTADGAVQGFNQDNTWRGPIKPVNRVAIGSRQAGDFGVQGLIDDVRVQRLDPLEVDRNFRRRPVDDSVRHCWDDWGRKILELLNNDRKCARELIEVLIAAQQSASLGVRGPLVHEPAAAAAEVYATHWAQGELNQIPSGAIELADFAQTQFDLKNNRDLKALLASSCFRTLIEGMPPMTCDPEFSEMLTAIAEGL